MVASEPINWRVVLSSSSSTVLLPQLPTGGYSMFPLPGEVSDSSAATPGFNLTRDDGRKGLWREFAGNLQPYAETGITGAVGPGRTGCESLHVFRLLGAFDSNDKDQRILAARAEIRCSRSTTQVMASGRSATREMSRSRALVLTARSAQVSAVNGFSVPISTSSIPSTSRICTPCPRVVYCSTRA
ncbi:MAG: hypothetical protein IPH50_03805 [Rhodanobacteraceae bacterium]|nr:hypothetical protein [Rhodanobacteraceae bacterium]